MTKKDIVKQICDKTSLPYSQVRVVVQSTIDAIIETVLKEGKIELRNFGVFKIKHRAPEGARPENRRNSSRPRQEGYRLQGWTLA